EHAGPVPIALRPDDHIGIAVERDRIGAWLELEYHLGVGEVGEGDLAVMAERLCAEMRPKIHQPVLRMSVDLPEALALDVFEARLHQLERDARTPELMAHGEPLELGKFAEEADPQAGRRLTADETDEVRGDQVVAV